MVRFVAAAFAREEQLWLRKVRDGLRRMLSRPSNLYRLGRKQEALASAGEERSFDEKALLLKLLIADGEIDAAASVFETLGATPPELADGCAAWFDPVVGIGLADIGDAFSTRAEIGRFLDRLPGSPLFRRICPHGLDTETTVSLLQAAGRPDAAIARARTVRDKPFLLIDVLLQTARVDLRHMAPAAAIPLLKEAAAALPPFRFPNPIDPDAANRPLPPGGALPHDFGETSGDTGRRFAIIQLLAASGALDEADALARQQLPGALRAIALSAAIAGRAGLRFDDQAPTLETIDTSQL